MNSDYSIVIPFHSSTSLLQCCVESLRKSAPDDIEIIIVANNRDPNELKISFSDANVKILKFNEDLFYPKAVNIGVEAAKNDHVLLCDADTFYTGDWFEPLTTCSRQNHAAIVGSKLLFTGTTRVRDFGMGFNGYNWPHPFKNRLPNHPLVLRDRPFQSVCTANCIVDKRMFQQVGGLSEELGFSYSDMDLCLRFRANGMPVWGCGRSPVFHKGSSIHRDMSHYRKDTRGKFCERNAQRFTVDMELYYEESAEYYRQRYPICNEYVWVDLSSVYNKDWHEQVIEDVLGCRIVDRYLFEQTPRDVPHIDLYESIPSYVFQLRIPLIYFVDNYTALQDNALWLNLRDDPSDIIVDRHGNIEAFSRTSPQRYLCEEESRFG